MSIQSFLKKNLLKLKEKVLIPCFQGELLLSGMGRMIVEDTLYATGWAGIILHIEVLYERKE